MANFDVALKVVLSHEDPHLSGIITRDEGGRTRFGLAERWHGELTPSGFFDAMGRDEALALAEKTYRTSGYWKFEGLENQVVATKAMDLAVNAGPHEAVLCLQKVTNARGDGSLIEDGEYGPVTEKAVNLACRDHAPFFIDEMCNVALKFYQDLATRQHRTANELASWEARAKWTGNYA